MKTLDFFVKIYSMGMTFTITSIASIAYTFALVNHSIKWENEEEEFRIIEGIVAFLLEGNKSMIVLVTNHEQVA